MWVIYHRVIPVFLGATGSGSITHARGVWFVIYCCPYFGNTANETGILDISFFTFMAGGMVLLARLNIFTREGACV